MRGVQQYSVSVMACCFRLVHFSTLEAFISRTKIKLLSMLLTVHEEQAMSLPKSGPNNTCRNECTTSCCGHSHQQRCLQLCLTKLCVGQTFPFWFRHGRNRIKNSCVRNIFTLLPSSTRPFTEDTGRLCLCTFFNLSDAFFIDSSAFVTMLQWMTAFSI